MTVGRFQRKPPSRHPGESRSPAIPTQASPPVPVIPAKASPPVIPAKAGTHFAFA